ncbi:MAG TPA: hypothetical protein VM557_07855 [Thermoanaerobaculia bacterium]|nr:hypothetical protein [Thermoanaerobaculia bacterium]
MIARSSIAFALALILAAALPVEAARRRLVVRPAAGAPQPELVVVQDDFRFGPLGWEAGFADYSPVNGDMELVAEIRPLPPEIAPTGTAFFLQGHNRSDDLFMFLKKKLTVADGIRPGQRYEATFRIVFDSNAGNGDACAGIGGAPGASLYLKAGVSGEEPRVVLDDSDHWRMTVDKGNQSTSGPAGSVVGTIENGTSRCDSEAPFVRLIKMHRHPWLVSASPVGELWVLVGTDSGFEGLTRIYYESIEVTLRPVP